MEVGVTVQISDMKFLEVDIARFGRVAKVTRLGLSSRHSNAGEERVSSVIHEVR